MRTIDADALKRRAQKVATEAWKMKIEAKVETVLNQFIDWIDEAPTIQAEPHWVPVTERLPNKKEKSYWVCLEGGGQCQCRWTNDMYGLGANEWSKWGWHVMDKPQYSVIVAWMPLPESYKEVTE